MSVASPAAALRHGRRTILGNTALQVAGYAAGMGLTAGSAALLTRYLGVSGFGLVSLVTVVFALGGSVVNGSLDTFAVRAFAAEDSVDPLLFRSLLAVKLMLSAALTAGAVAVTFFLPLGAETRLAVLVLGLVAVAASLQGGIFAATQSRRLFGLPVAADTGLRALILAGTAALFLAPHPHSGPVRVVLFAAVAAAAGALVLSFTVSRARSLGLPVGVAFDRGAWGRLARGPAAIGAVAVLGLLNYRVDVLVLAALRGTHDVGVYAVATRFVEAALPIGGAFVAASFPVVARAAAVRATRLADEVERALLVLVLLGAALAAVLVAAAPYLVDALAGPSFAGAVTPLRILALSLPFTFAAQFVLYVLIANHLQRRVLPVAAASFLANLALNAALVPFLSVTAPALATLATEVAGACYLALLARRTTGLRLGGTS